MLVPSYLVNQASRDVAFRGATALSCLVPRVQNLIGWPEEPNPPPGETQTVAKRKGVPVEYHYRLSTNFEGPCLNA